MTAHPIDTEALRKITDAATEGPWEAHGTTIAAITGSGSCQGCSGLVSPAHEPSCYWSEIAAAGEADAEFIAAARTAVPALLDALAAAEHRATRDEARIKAVREPHQPDGHDPDLCGEPDCFASCIEDGMEWPCDTIRALD